MSSESEFAYSLKYNTHFIVRNITGQANSMLHLAGDNPAIPPPYRSTIFYLSPKKTISIFHYPINAGDTRDLLQIPGVQEADIRASLLKGELRHKFLCGDIELVSSNIDLLQFSDKQREWLQSYGFTEGVTIGWDELDGYVQGQIEAGGGGGGGDGYITYLWRERIPLIGLRNASNRTFYTPDKFINGSYYNNIFNIAVEHNGKQLYENIDFTIAESGGPGTGYDTIFIKSIVPNAHSLLFATYTIVAP
jgi:hypothetical protein